MIELPIWVLIVCLVAAWTAGILVGESFIEWRERESERLRQREGIAMQSLVTCDICEARVPWYMAWIFRTTAVPEGTMVCAPCASWLKFNAKQSEDPTLTAVTRSDLTGAGQ